MKPFVYTSLARLCGALMLVGCSSPSGPVWRPALTTDASTYWPGATIAATVYNRSDFDVAFGACPFVIERRTGDQWIPVPREAGDCDGSLHLLRAGREARLEFSLETEMEPGTYRLVMGIVPRTTDPWKFLRSAPFRVAR